MLPDIAPGAGAAVPLACAGRSAGLRGVRGVADRRRRHTEGSGAVIGRGARVAGGGHDESVAKAPLESARLGNHRIAGIQEECLRGRGGEVKTRVVNDVTTVLSIPEGLVLAVHVVEAEDCTNTNTNAAQSLRNIPGYRGQVWSDCCVVTGGDRDVLVLGSGGKGHHAVHDLLVHVVVREPLFLLGRWLELQRHDHGEDNVDKTCRAGTNDDLSEISWASYIVVGIGGAANCTI